MSIYRKQRLVDAGRSMAAAAARHEEALRDGGFPRDTIAQISAAVDALSEAMVEGDSSRVERIGATKGIASEFDRGREGVKLLNSVITMQFASDEPFLASWRAASRVGAKQGSLRGSSVVEVVSPVQKSNAEPVPASGGEPSSRKAA